MKKENTVKKAGVIVAIIVLLAISFFIVKKGTGIFSFGGSSGGDLVIYNDSKDTASSAFMRDGKMVSQVINAGERASGGRGLIRIFIAKKNGAYEIQYPYPRPAGKPVEVSLTQVLSVAKNPTVGAELITEKGMIDDISVNYEEVRD